MRSGQPRHRQPRHRHWVGIGVTAGIVGAVTLAGLGVWGTATLAARGTDHIGTLTAVSPLATAHAATVPPHHHTWLPNRRPLGMTTTSRRAAVREVARPTATTTVPTHTTCPLCTTVFTVPLPHDAHLDGVAWRNGSTSFEGWLDYYVAGRLAARSGLSEDTPQPGDWDHPVAAVCRPAAAVAHCAVAYDTGAHSSAVLLATVAPASGIRITDRVVGDSAGSWVTDLNGDGLPDASVVDSTMRPDYATAPRFWHTYVQRAGKLVSTGCSLPAVLLAPRPARAETGACPR